MKINNRTKKTYFIRIKIFLEGIVVELTLDKELN